MPLTDSMSEFKRRRNQRKKVGSTDRLHMLFKAWSGMLEAHVACVAMHRPPVCADLACQPCVLVAHFSKHVLAHFFILFFNYAGENS